MLYTTYEFYKNKRNISDDMVCKVCKIEKIVIEVMRENGYIEDINIDAKLMDYLFIPIRRIVSDYKKIEKVKTTLCR